MNSTATLYLIPAPLAEDGLEVIPPYILTAIKACSAFYVEEEKTTRRFFKKIWKEMVIDDYNWYNIKGLDNEMMTSFKNDLQAGHTVGIVSEAGCPGVADPGQELVAVAQDAGAIIKPLVGPGSILLALMASGMNGQQFRFRGYLPIESQLRVKEIQKIEAESAKENCTQIFIETPYRNNQLFDSILKSCKPDTRICVAVDLTSANESVKTMKVKDWKKQQVDLHKKPAIFLLNAE